MTHDDGRPLAGYTIGITDDRRGEEQADMLTRRGARIVHGPTMATAPLGDLDATIAATRRVMAAPVDTVVFTTGIGIHSWFAAAESAGLDEELRLTLARGRVVARGPQAHHAARCVGLEIAWTAPSDTNDEVFAGLGDEGVAGQRIVVQRDGGPPLLADAVRALGPAEIIDVPIAEWHLPADRTPALRLLEAATARQVDAVTFTCAYAVHNAFEMVADTDGLVAAFADGVVAVAIGPGTAQALRSHGVGRVVEPERARLDSMVHALTGELAGRTRLLHLGAVWRRWQGMALIDPDGAEVELTRGESRLLTTLAARAPTVVPKVALVEHGSDEHAAEAAIARLRAKLGPLGAGIRTVRRRGYACTLRITAGSAPDPVLRPIAGHR